VEILFDDGDLERLCSEERTMKRKLGTSGAKKLRTRLAELEAARCVPDLAAGRPHPLLKDRHGQYSVDLDGGRRLVFRPTRQPPPVRNDGGIDWQQVTSVTIVFLGDYHD
jgi:proteic killer suppression protein